MAIAYVYFPLKSAIADLTFEQVIDPRFQGPGNFFLAPSCDWPAQEALQLRGWRKLLLAAMGLNVQEDWQDGPEKGSRERRLAG